MNGGAKVFKITYDWSIVGIEDPLTELCSNSYLSLISPNPFNDITTISYELESASYIDLSIYNLTGEKIITLIKENKEMGKYNIELDAAWLVNGIYFCV